MTQFTGLKFGKFGLTERLACAAVLLAFVLVTGYAVSQYRLTLQTPLRVTAYPGQWIRAAGPLARAGYFRKRFDLPGQVKHAWIKIAATDAFEISVNKNPLGRVYLWRPTRPFQTGIGEKGQRLMQQSPAMDLNFPREYQWSGHDSWRLPSYIEITNAFRPGKNVITIEAESRSPSARVCFDGEIQMHDGTIIPITSDETWRGEPAIVGLQKSDWTELDYRDTDWRHAAVAAGPDSIAYRSLSPQIYTDAFAGLWLRHPDAAGGTAVNFTADWRIDRPVDEAWIRLLTNRRYELYLNGQRIRVASNKPPDLDNGDWVFGRATALDPTTKPELLDPDEVGSSFIGQRFESPRKGQGNLGEFRNPFSPKITPFRYIRTYNRAQEPGVWDPKRTQAEARRTPSTAEGYPERPVPNSLKRDSLVGGYLAYSVANLLRPGINRIEIRCFPKKDANWPAQIAVDGGAIRPDGQVFSFVKETDWQATATDTFGSDRPTQQVPALRLGPAVVAGKSIPRLQYRGTALARQQLDTLLPVSLMQVGLVTLILVVGCVAASWAAPAKQDDAQPPNWLSTCQMLYAMLITATVAIGAGLLLECAWAERAEVIWSLNGRLWQVVFFVAIAASLLVGALDIIGRHQLDSLRDNGHQWIGRLRQLPHSRIWHHLCLWVLLLGIFLRAYKLDLQPLDDDEYASAQAIMAILETGQPAFVADHVYYTRSPLFHYLTAAIAWPLGGNLWSLRLQSVAWGIGTAWLAYLCGANLLKNRWVGFLAMLMICIHPFEIFTGHVIRFYQMQQFFALLTMYWFCRGFVTQQSQKYRVATLIAFLAAVLSQEISVAMGPSLLFGYLLFAKDLGWRKNISLGLLSISIVALIGLDFVVFQNLCLTRTEGVSPSIEASVKPHFWYPMNFLSMLFGYSRLHVAASFFLVAGIPLLWREQNKNTLALLAFLVSGVVMTNLLVTTVSFRYQYWLVPLWLLLSIDGMRLLLTTIINVVYPVKQKLNRHAAALTVCCGICVAMVVASWSPWRIAGSYELSILGDSTGAVRWVRSQKRPGDRVAITEPHTHCAYLESGKCDYDIALPLLYDFAVMQDGVLVDRNGGGEVVSHVDQLIGEFSQGNRIWILLNREKFRTRGKNLRWEYPGARFEVFIRKNCELKYRTYLWSVYLWDPAQGIYEPFRMQE